MAYVHPIEVRFADLDPLDHVNNAVLLSYLEQSRFQWWRGYLAGRPFSEEGFLIARIEVDYRAPILMGDDVSIELRCTKVGRTSFDLAYRVTRGNGRVVLAEAKTVQVMLDFGTQRPKEIRAETRIWLEGQA